MKDVTTRKRARINGVRQTEFGKPYGNCFSAVVATLMELGDVRAVPLFALYGDHWEAAAQWWCSLKGYELGQIMDVEKAALLVDDQDETMIGSGKVASGLWHAVVWTPKQGIVFDPAAHHREERPEITMARTFRRFVKEGALGVSTPA